MKTTRLSFFSACLLVILWLGAPLLMVKDVRADHHDPTEILMRYMEALLEISKQLNAEAKTVTMDDIVGRLYEHCGHKGKVTYLLEGDYRLSNLKALGMKNDSASSIVLNSGYQAIVYEHDNFGGNKKVKTASDTCFSPFWNDRITSLKVMVAGQLRYPFDFSMAEINGLGPGGMIFLGQLPFPNSYTSVKAPIGSANMGSLYFDGSGRTHAIIRNDSRINFGRNSDFTVSAWIKPAANQPHTRNSDNDVIEKWAESGGYPFVIRYINQTHANNGKIVVSRYDGSRNPAITSTVTINDGQFHHVAFVKRGNTLKLFIDGVLDGQTTDTTTGNTTNNSPLYLGRRGVGASNPNFFKGAIDDLRIYDHAISDAKLAALAGYSVEPTESVTITLLGAHGKYATAERDGRVNANRTAIGPWENFTLITHADGTVSLRSHHGKYVVAEADGSLNANRTAIGSWEKFTRIDNSDGSVSFRSHHGKYVVAESDGTMNANRTAIGPWERFQLGTDI